MRANWNSHLRRESTSSWIISTGDNARIPTKFDLGKLNRPRKGRCLPVYFSFQSQ